jgi:hypothetical protein
VNFDKIQKVLPRFECQWTAETGAKQMRQVFEAIAMDEPTFRSAPYTRLKMLMRLKEAQLLDNKLFWTFA